MAMRKPIQLEEEQEQVRSLFERLEEQTKPTKGKGSRGPRSEETKAKISAGLTGKPGKPRTLEERESISQGLTAYHAGKKSFVK